MHPNSFIAGLIVGVALTMVGAVVNSEPLTGLSIGVVFAVLAERFIVHGFLPQYLPLWRRGR
jgi:hypothetical protein